MINASVAGFTKLIIHNRLRTSSALCAQLKEFFNPYSPRGNGRLRESIIRFLVDYVKQHAG